MTPPSRPRLGVLITRGVGWVLFVGLTVLGLLDLIGRPRDAFSRVHWLSLGLVIVTAGLCYWVWRRWGRESQLSWFRPATLRAVVLAVVLVAAYDADQQERAPVKVLLHVLQTCDRPTERTVDNGGDPGDRILHAMEAEPIFGSLPAAETGLGVKSTAASYSGGCFDGGGWSGPSVSVCLQTSLSPAEVFRRTDESAARAGWSANADNAAAEVINGWQKPGPEPGTTLHLTLDHLRCGPRGEAGEYRLSTYG